MRKLKALSVAAIFAALIAVASAPASAAVPNYIPPPPPAEQICAQAGTISLYVYDAWVGGNFLGYTGPILSDFSTLRTLSQNNPPFQAQSVAWSNAINTLIADVQNNDSQNTIDGALGSYDNNQQNTANSCIVRDYPFTVYALGEI